jgi:hypothetical protein
MDLPRRSQGAAIGLCRCRRCKACVTRRRADTLTTDRSPAACTCKLALCQAPRTLGRRRPARLPCVPGERRRRTALRLAFKPHGQRTAWRGSCNILVGALQMPLRSSVAVRRSPNRNAAPCSAKFKPRPRMVRSRFSRRIGCHAVAGTRRVHRRRSWGGNAARTVVAWRRRAQPTAGTS